MSVHLMPLPAERFDEWRAAARKRLIDGNRVSDRRPGVDAVAHVDQLFGELFPDSAATATARAMRVVVDAEGEVGTLLLISRDDKLFLLDLVVDEPLADVHSDDLLAEILRMAREEGARQVGMQLFPQDTTGRAFASGRGFEVASIQMVLEPLPARDVAPHVDVSPMTPERFPTFATASEEGFANDLVESGRYTPEEALAESHRQMIAELPDGLDTTGQELFTASVDGTEAGILWVGVRQREGRPHVFVMDIEVAAAHRRRGYGRELMHAVEREARRLGADSIGLHVFGFNTGAIDLYEQLGYRRTEESLLRDV
ncbi:GNAT family N-acetyltransferase [Microbacterium oxydans]|uniref:GNAT family N-acetyltransferase n=1 Tax=Microbacterium oxydans TaxID=82380 RepID=UPI0024AD3EA2|nr:GNAT family N-acetyltransferase [Microbacterium oxydans]